jgi:PhnB protein
MAKVSTYLNFSRNTEEAFNFCRKVFRSEFMGAISSFSDMPPSENMPLLPEEDSNLVMHVVLPILGGHLLIGPDAPESMGFRISQGINVFLSEVLSKKTFSASDFRLK